MSRHDIATVIPVAPPGEAKQRLGSVLGPDDRADLARRMLFRTIEAALEVGTVIVVSRSPEVLESARAAGATGLLEVGTTLDDAVAQGLARVVHEATAAHEATGAIVVPADLPLVTGDALADLLAGAGSHEQAVVVAPCQRRDGTNGMVLRPPSIIAPRYGPGSAARHLAAGRSTGAHVVEVTDRRFVDLDTPEDWARFGNTLREGVARGGLVGSTGRTATVVQSEPARHPVAINRGAPVVTTVARTPDERFRDLVDWPWESTYAEITVDGLDLRVAWVDEGPPDAHPVVLLHGEPTWGYLWRHVVPPLLDAGHRVVVPDQVGFGRSDKPQGREWYSYPRLADALDQTMAAAVGDAAVTLVVHDWGGMLGLPWAARHARQVARMVILNTGLYRPGMRMSEDWQRFHDFVARSDEFPVTRMIAGAQLSAVSEEEARAWEAPFPDPSFHGGPLAMPGLVIRAEDQPGADDHIAAWEVLEAWDHAPVLTLWGAKDPIIPPLVGERIAARIPAAVEPEIVEGAHFLQNDAGPEIGERIVEFIVATPA